MSHAGKVMVLVGTRPEVVKMAPIVMELRRRGAVDGRPTGMSSLLVSSGQHREMLAQALKSFGLEPDEDLAVMRANQDLSSLTARLLEGLSGLFRRLRPDVVLVQATPPRCLPGRSRLSTKGFPSATSRRDCAPTTLAPRGPRR